MFDGSSTFVRFGRYRQYASSAPWWLVMAPGLMLIFVGLVILIWPQLLAYMIASMILFVGISISLWGWSMRYLKQRQSSSEPPKTVYYDQS